MNHLHDEACPIPGCGKPCSGNRRGHLLTVNCPVHGRVQYNFETDTHTVLNEK